MKDVQIKPGDFFDQPKMTADVVTIQDVYGSQGYIFANVQPEPRFFEEPGQLDLVYSIDEGKRYRVGRIDVKITGEHPHTRVRTVLNRMSLRPGDIVDTRELRASERRLKASQLFNVDPAKGISPKIVLVPQDEADGSFANKPRKPNSGRGQSPDPQPGHVPPFAPPARVVPPGASPAPSPPVIIRGQSPDNNSTLNWRRQSSPPPPESPREQVAPADRVYSPPIHLPVSPPRQTPQIGHRQTPAVQPPVRGRLQTSYSPLIRAQSPAGRRRRTISPALHCHGRMGRRRSTACRP